MPHYTVNVSYVTYAMHGTRTHKADMAEGHNIPPVAFHTH